MAMERLRGVFGDQLLEDRRGLADRNLTFWMSAKVLEQSP